MSIAPRSAPAGQPRGWVPATGTWPHELSHEPRLRVGDVLAALQPEFASLSPSKLRFLDAQSLVSPSRTPAGYRLYSSADVERLRYVLRQQRDAYAPLQVIRERLAQLDAGTAHLPIAASLGPSEERLGVEDFASLAGIAVGVVTKLMDEGLLPSPEPGLCEHRHVPLATACAGYLEAGGDVRGLRSLLRNAQREAEAADAAAAPLARKDDQLARIAAARLWRARAAEVFSAALLADDIGT